MKKRDFCYLVFFIIHVPVMLIVDLVPLYPAAVQEKLPFLLQLRQWYIDTYKDRFFTQPPAFFTFYAWMEAFYHLPVSLWAIGALIRDDPKLPLALLLFGAQTAITTGTCVAEYLSWEGYSRQEKVALGGLYIPYLVLASLMCLDMYTRLDASLTTRRSSGKKKSS